MGSGDTWRRRGSGTLAFLCKGVAFQRITRLLVVLELGRKNLFGSVEWTLIRASIAAHFEEAAAWTEWVHREATVVQLPHGAEAAVDRGAEQGDTFGSTQASLALGDHMDIARKAYADATEAMRNGGPLGAVDEWFIDDDQAFVKPEYADTWLHAVDNALRSMGAVRGVGDECKSVARLL